MIRKYAIFIGAVLLLILVFGAFSALGYGSAQTTRALPASGLVIPHQAGNMLTTQQVQAYVNGHAFWVGPTTTGQMFTIQTLRLMTARQAYQEERVDSLGVPLNALVYYVKVKGPFKPLGLHLPPAAHLPATVLWGYEVWDAYSGKLLEAGL